MARSRIERATIERGRAELATKESIAPMIKHTPGVLCCAVQGERALELELRPMVETKCTAFTVSADLLVGKGITTGILASDRAELCGLSLIQ